MRQLARRPRAARRRAARRSPRSRGPCWCRGRRRRWPGRARSARRPRSWSRVGGEPQPGVDDVDHGSDTSTAGVAPESRRAAATAAAAPEGGVGRRPRSGSSGRQTPQRRAGVWTGASHQRVSSSSSRRSVTEKPGHLEARDVVPDERAPDRDALPAEDPGDAVERDVQLDERRAAHPVDEREDGVAALTGRGRTTIGDTSHSAMSSTGASFSRRRPGSPWMPMPTSTSSSGRSNVGVPAAGTTHEVSARPIERPWSLTLVAVAATSASDPPASAWAPAIFSSRTVTPTPRRPAVYSESWTATSSLVTTVATSMSPADELGRHLEVQDVAGVVLDDVQDAGAAVDGAGGGLHLVRHGRGEDVAGGGRVEHAQADEPAVQRFVTGAAARDQGDLALASGRRRAGRGSARGRP